MDSNSKPPPGRMAAAVAQVLGVLEAGGAPVDYVTVSWGPRTQTMTVHAVYDTADEAAAAAAVFPPDSGAGFFRPTSWTWAGQLGDVSVRLMGARADAEVTEAAS